MGGAGQAVRDSWDAISRAIPFVGSSRLRDDLTRRYREQTGKDPISPSAETPEPGVVMGADRAQKVAAMEAAAQQQAPSGGQVALSQAGPPTAGLGMAAPPQQAMPQLGGLEGHMARTQGIGRQYATATGAATKARKEAVNQQITAIEDAATIQKTIAREQGELRAAQQAEVDKINADQLERQKAVRENEQKYQRKIDTFTNLYATKQVQPGRAMASTGNRVMALLGMALEGLGNAMAGKTGPLNSIAIIQQAIDNDVAQQQAEIERYRTVANDLMRQRGASQDSWISEREAFDEARKMVSNRYLAEMDKIAAKYSDRTIGIKAAEDSAKLRQSLAQDEETSAANRAATALAVEGQVGRAESAQQANQVKMAKLLETSKGKQLPPSQTDKLAAYRVIVKNFGKLKKLYREATEGVDLFGAGKIVPGSKAQEYDTLRKTTQEKVVRLLTGAQAPENEIKTVAGYFPGLSDLSGTAENKFNALKVLGQDEYIGRMQSYADTGYNVSKLAARDQAEGLFQDWEETKQAVGMVQD